MEITNQKRNAFLTLRRELKREPSRKELRGIGLNSKEINQLKHNTIKRSLDKITTGEVQAFKGATKLLSIILLIMIGGCLYLSFKFTYEFLNAYFFDSDGAAIGSFLTVSGLSVFLPIGEICIEQRKKVLGFLAFSLWSVLLLFSITSTISVAYDKMMISYAERFIEEAENESKDTALDLLNKDEQTALAELDSIETLITQKLNDVELKRQEIATYNSQLSNTPQTLTEDGREVNNPRYNIILWRITTANRETETLQEQLTALTADKAELIAKLEGIREEIKEQSVETKDYVILTFFDWLHGIFKSIPLFWIQFIIILIPAIVVDFINSFGSVVILILNKKNTPIL